MSAADLERWRYGHDFGGQLSTFLRMSRQLRDSFFQSFLPGGVRGKGLGVKRGQQVVPDGNLRSVFFKGNAPSVYSTAFNSAPQVTVYYLPGTTGWQPTFGSRPTTLWDPQVQADGSLGVRANQFGFNITGTPGIPIAVEACANLADPAWTRLQTCTLTNGSIYFSDPQWTNYPSRLPLAVAVNEER